jgi:hypothetical protein
MRLNALSRRHQGGERSDGQAAFDGLPIGKKWVVRSRQAEVLAQRGAFVLATKQSAPLQLGDHKVNEFMKSGRDRMEHHVEPVGRFDASTPSGECGT